MHSIKHENLEIAVLHTIKQQAYLAYTYAEMITRINASPLKKIQLARLLDTISGKEKELAKVKRYKQGLYEDLKDGIITRDDYRHMTEDYERQAAALQTVLGNLQAEQAELEKGIDTENPFITAFRKYQNIDVLTREILTELIEYVKIYEGGHISVHFKFSDELRRIVEFIKINEENVLKIA